MQFYPNPVKDKLFVKLKSSVNNGVLEIIDLRGRLIAVQSINQKSRFEVNTLTLEGGLYFLKLKSETFNGTIKFIKE